MVRENDGWEDKIERSGNCYGGRGEWAILGRTRRLWVQRQDQESIPYSSNPTAEANGTFSWGWKLLVAPTEVAW